METIHTEQFRVKEGEKVSLKKRPTLVPPVCKSKVQYKAMLQDYVVQLSKLQQVHYADDRYAVLLIFQAMDAAGKDGIIRHVMSGVIPRDARFTVSGILLPKNSITIFSGEPAGPCLSVAA